MRHSRRKRRTSRKHSVFRGNELIRSLQASVWIYIADVAVLSLFGFSDVLRKPSFMFHLFSFPTCEEDNTSLTWIMDTVYYVFSQAAIKKTDDD